MNSMEQEILERLKKNEEKLDQIYTSVEKTRKYLFWTFVVTIVVVVLPLLGVLAAIPQFMSTYNSLGGI